MAAVHAEPQTIDVPRGRKRNALWRYLAVAGPGLIVAFADTEAGSITTAATSGAQFGMKLVLLQLLLIVPLFVVQEMTVRLGTVTGKGHAQLIRENYGLGWTWVSLGTMLVTNLAALVTEFIGVAGVALIFGVPVAPMVIAAAVLLIGIAFSGRYKRAEVLALGLCLLELLFIPAAFAAHPDPGTLLREGLLGNQPLANREYLLLVAGNIGAVIMPWMIFYQQSATVDKGLEPKDLRHARVDTAIGAVLTQVIMVAVVVTCAATLFVHHVNVSDAAHAALALVPLTGSKLAGIAFGAGLLGAALLGALVVSLASAWAFGEAFQWRCSLNNAAHEAKRFYGMYAGMVIAAAGIVLIPHLPLIRITIWVEAFNAFVLPIVLGFLLVLSNDKKILGARVNSRLGNVVAIGVAVVCVGLGVWMGTLTILGQAG
ncbi:MAG TPA: divalent metal cation transporter [Candidatus Elarobacter sp.]|jgi:NRAMP (natural resistance-associated macrophage protein)-like metal ion transporter|nr:divalent metal cation transporter [Candidatus Elarobacter sp.]